MDTALLVNDTSIGKQGHRFASSEVEQDVGVGDEEHLLDLVELLEANDADLARTWSRLEYETELTLLLLTHKDHVCSHGHALNGADCPLFASGIILVFRLIRTFIVITLILCIPVDLAGALFTKVVLGDA